MTSLNELLKPNLPRGAGKPGERVPVTVWEAENRTANHLKFYRCMASADGLLILQYGRIGTVGQFKVEKLATEEAAKTIALRQFYSKTAKGYSPLVEEFRFTVERVIHDADKDPARGQVFAGRYEEARRENRFNQEKEVAATLYDKFITEAEKLMTRAASEDPLGLLDDWKALQAAWIELSDKHGTAGTTISILGQMIDTRLRGSA